MKINMSQILSKNLYASVDGPGANVLPNGNGPGAAGNPATSTLPSVSADGSSTSSLSSSSSYSAGGGASAVGINCDPSSMKNGQCSLDVYSTLGIKSDGGSTTMDEFVKDAFLGATYFIGTVVTIAIIVSSIMLIMAGANEKLQDKGKKGIQYSLYGMILVLFSYTIIRVVQYLAKG